MLQQERGLEDGERFVHQVLEDASQSRLTDPEKKLFRFIDKVNHDSFRIEPKDIEELHAAGWTDDALYYAITVCALFNFYNRWIDATGVHPLSEETHRENAARFAAAGYIRK